MLSSSVDTPDIRLWKHWMLCGGSSIQPFCDGSHSGTSFTPHVFTAEKSGEAHLCMCKRTGNVPFCDGTHATLDEAES
jgi:CDGSH-type Zn-finger protein